MLLANLLTVVKFESEYKFKEWQDIPYPPGLNASNCEILYSYYDTNPSLTIILKFNKEKTKFSIYNTNSNDSNYTIRFFFFRILLLGS